MEAPAANDDDVLSMLLSTFCSDSDYEDLKRIFVAQRMKIKSLRGFTKAELMAAVKGESGPHLQVPAWLEQQVPGTSRTLGSFLKSGVGSDGERLVLKLLEELKIDTVATSQKVDATSQKVDATSQKVDATSQKVDKLLMVGVEGSKSDAQIGSELLERLKRQNRVVESLSDEPALFSLEEWNTIKAGSTSEEAFVEFMTPKLCELLNGHENLVFVNSERVQWIDTKGTSSFNRKPDGWIGCSFFFEHAGNRDDVEKGETRFIFGKPAHWTLRDGVNSIIQVKLTALNDAVGQLKKDMEFICDGEAEDRERTGIALLLDKFYVFHFLGSAAEKVASAKWVDPGSRKLLQDGLLFGDWWAGGGKLIANSLKVKFVTNGFCGMGAYGRVVKVVSDDNSTLALKMVASRDVTRCHRVLKEFQNLLSAANTGVVVSVKECCSEILAWNGLSLCGYTMECGVPASLNNVKDLLNALAKLHCGGWLHGDARVANIVFVQRRGLVWVDMTDATRFDIGVADDDSKRSLRTLIVLEMTKFIQSVYARKNHVSSPDTKPSRAIKESVTAYANAVLARTLLELDRSINTLHDTLQNWKCLE